MRIAVVTTSYPAYEGDPCGHFVQTEVADLARVGHEVLVIRPRAGGAFGWPGAPARIRERPQRIFEAAAWTVRASIELKRFRPDRVIAHWCIPSALPIALGVTRRGGPRSPELDVVSHGGDVRLLCVLPHRVRTELVRALLGRVRTWRFVSESLRLALEATLHAEERAALRAKSEILPGALDVPDVRDEARLKRSALGGRRLYVCAGRLVASKRVDKVIDYVATTDDDRADKGARVLVVLGDGPQRAQLERLARAWQIDVRFLGKTTRREALEWIGAADELVHASRVEGLSTVVREAETLGVPVKILS